MNPQIEQRFEHHHKYTGGNGDSVENVLIKFEKDGWELIAVVGGSYGTNCLYFKRPFNPPTK